MVEHLEFTGEELGSSGQWWSTCLESPSDGWAGFVALVETYLESTTEGLGNLTPGELPT